MISTQRNKNHFDLYLLAVLIYIEKMSLPFFFHSPIPSYTYLRILIIEVSQMFKNTYQSGFLSILYSIGSKPLQIWDKQSTFPPIQSKTVT